MMQTSQRGGNERKEGSTGAGEGGGREVSWDDLLEAAEETKEWLQNRDKKRVRLMSSWKTNTRGDRWVLRLKKPHGRVRHLPITTTTYTRNTKAMATDAASRS